MLTSNHAEYLANLPDTWKRVPLWTIGTVHAGGTPSRTNLSYWNGSIPWVTPSELTALPTKELGQARERITEAGLIDSSAVLLPAGSLIVTTRATIGNVAIAGVPLCTNQGFKSVVLSDATDIGFCYHLLKFITREFVRLASGTTFLEISASDFASVVVPIPPLSEQRCIADILDAADEAIRRTEQVVAKLKAVKTGLLHDLLTRGLDEHGRLRDPQAHPEQFKDSPVGKVPKGWSTPILDKLVQDDAPICYGIVQPGPFTESGVPVVAIYNLDGDFRAGVHKSSEEVEKKYVRSRIMAWDVLLSIKGTIGRVEVVPEWFRGNISRDIARIRLRPSVLPQYLFHMLSAPITQIRLQSVSVGTTRAEVSIWILKQFKVPIPPINEQQQIADAADAHYARIRAEEAELAKLRQVKRGLMDDLLTGKVRTV